MGSRLITIPWREPIEPLILLSEAEAPWWLAYCCAGTGRESKSRSVDHYSQMRREMLREHKLAADKATPRREHLAMCVPSPPLLLPRLPPPLSS
mgnify:CR=1 FL=1